jgi:mRNA interferase MazF
MKKLTYERDYTKWHTLKERLEQRADVPNFMVCDIWWCAIGTNLGYEQDGKNDLCERPVLVLKKFNKELFFGLPMTSRVKENLFHYKLSYRGRDTFVILSQGRIFSSKRLLRKIWRINSDDLRSIFHSYTSLVTDKTISQQAGRSRIPNGNLYSHYSKENLKKQGKL